MDYFAKSIELHKACNGKLETISRVPVKTAEDLSTAYSPGVAEPCRAIAKDPKLANTLTIK